MFLESQVLRAQGESVRSDRIDALLASTGLALRESALRERGLLEIGATLRRSNIAGARKRWQALRKAVPDLERISLAKGVIEESAGNRLAAIDAYRQADSLATEDPSIPLRLGLLLAADEPEAAAKAFERSLQLSPFSPGALAGAARIALRAGRSQEAESRLREIRAISPLGERAEARDLAARIDAHRGNEVAR